MAKADIVVFRNENQILLVRPAVFVVEYKGNHNKFWIRNDAEGDVTIKITHDDDTVTETLTSTGNTRKKQVDVTNITQNGTSVVFYEASIGTEVAQGESAPTLIIDD